MNKDNKYTKYAPQNSLEDYSTVFIFFLSIFKITPNQCYKLLGYFNVIPFFLEFGFVFGCLYE